MSENEIQGRASEYKDLSDDIASFEAARGASFGIIGISGLGGVGKSYLLDYVLRESKPHLADALIIRVDGSNTKLLTDFAGLVNHQLAPRILPGAPPKDFFHLTRRLVNALYAVQCGVENDIDREEGLQKSVKSVAKAIYKARPLLSKIPKGGKYVGLLLQILEAADAHEHVPKAIEALNELKLPKRSRSFFGHRSAKEMVRDNPYTAIADAYFGDVRAAVVGYRKRDFSYALPGKLPGKKRFLLIVDDFETTSAVFGDFLVENLLRIFEGAPFPVLVVILGRDDLSEEHTDFHQHFGKAIIRKIRLEAFSFQDAIQYLQNAGYNREQAEEIYKKSTGYPFVLSMFAEHRSKAEQHTVLFYQRFFERTTHWMTENEKDWLLKLSYLDVVNTGTVAVMLPQVDPNIVVEWFRKEASVRDTQARRYTVQPFIREMLLTYHGNLIGTKERSAFEVRAREAMANV
jgi:hypothetical protein